MRNHRGTSCVRRVRVAAVIATCALTAASCTSEGPVSHPTTSTAVTGSPASPVPERPPPRGGTLRLALTTGLPGGLDPQKAYYDVTWELFRCCLLRTLLTYDEDGELRPDLVSRMPTATENGLTWTFRLRPDIHYSPPLEDLTVESPDVVRALEREAWAKCSDHQYDGYYDVIEGFEEFASGDAPEISGLSTPDTSTLVVRLNEPAGDILDRFTLPATAPIPPLPSHPAARLGIATGHPVDFERFFVGTGPYMVVGTDRIEFDAAPEDQRRASGWVPDKRLRLVRNPAWSRRSDPLRWALPGGIDAEFTTASPESLLERVEKGDLDLLPDVRLDRETLERLRSAPSASRRLHSAVGSALYYMSMNLATPPFDDVHVRRAVNLVVDRRIAVRLWGGPDLAAGAGHVFPPTVLHGRLHRFAPYGSGHADLAAARAEMRLSRYDGNGDGRCDAPACRDVPAWGDEGDPYPEWAGEMNAELKRIGLLANIHSIPRPGTGRCFDPASHVALCIPLGWAQDYPDAATFAIPLFSGSRLGEGAGCPPRCSTAWNHSLLGARPSFLRRLDYEVTDVPSVDDWIDECEPLTGDERVACWARFDRRLMTEVVPVIPLVFRRETFVTSARVRNVRIGPALVMPMLDRLQLAPAS